MTYQRRSRHPLTASRVRALAVSPDARFVAFTAGDNKLHVHDAATGAEVKLIHVGADPSGLAFSPDGRFVATGSKTIHLYDTATWKPAGELKGHRHTINAVGFSADGALAYTGSGDHYTPADWSVRAWDSSGVEQARWKAEEDVKQLAVSPDGAHVAAGLYNGEIALLTADLKPVHELVPPDEPWMDLEQLAFSADGRTLFAVDNESSALLVIDVATGAKRELRVSGGASRVHGLADGSLLVWNGELVAVEPASGAVQWKLAGTGGSVDAFAVTPDEAVLVTIGEDPVEFVVYERIGGPVARAAPTPSPAPKPAPKKKPAKKK